MKYLKVTVRPAAILDLCKLEFLEQNVQECRGGTRRMLKGT